MKPTENANIYNVKLRCHEHCNFININGHLKTCM